MQPGATWEHSKKERWLRERLVKEGGETEKTWKDIPAGGGLASWLHYQSPEDRSRAALWQLAEQDRGLREMTSCYLFLTLLLICPHSFISYGVHQAPDGLRPLAVGAHSSGKPESCVLLCSHRIYTGHHPQHITVSAFYTSGIFIMGSNAHSLPELSDLSKSHDRAGLGFTAGSPETMAHCDLHPFSHLGSCD